MTKPKRRLSAKKRRLTNTQAVERLGAGAPPMPKCSDPDCAQCYPNLAAQEPKGEAAPHEESEQQTPFFARKDAVVTSHEEFHQALKDLEIVSIDGVPMAYMEFPVDIDYVSANPAANNFDSGKATLRHIIRWQYSTLRFGSHLPDPQARVELLTALFRLIKNAVVQTQDLTLHGQTCYPLIVWRSPPTFSADTDQVITYLRCRLHIPGVKLPSFETSRLDCGPIWVEGV